MLRMFCLIRTYPVLQVMSRAQAVSHLDCAVARDAIIITNTIEQHRNVVKFLTNTIFSLFLFFLQICVISLLSGSYSIYRVRGP